MHTETFDVLTTACGKSSLSIPLACASVETHYLRTTGSEDRQAETCSTGLRVYEGAQVLSSFLIQFSTTLIGPLKKDSTPIIAELGCGCGLVGFCAAHAYSKQKGIVVFTDASEDCLNLVRRSGALQDVRVVDHREVEADWNAVTFPLNWSPDGVGRLQMFLQQSLSNCRIQLILGSDIMYYRVDIDQLVTTVEHLLQPLEQKLPVSNCIPSLAVLCHFMRIPNGREKLIRTIHNKNMGVVKVSLAGFLDERVVSTRGWGGLEVLIIFQNSLNLPDLETARALFIQRRNIFHSLHQELEADQCDRLMRFLESYVVEEQTESIENWLSVDL